MFSKFKVKKKLVSIALALALAAQPLASFPMNVFAGTGKNGVMVAPTITYSFDLDNIIELAANTKFDAAAHAKNITPQDATVNYTVESQTVFSNNANDAVLDNDGKVIKPGIAKVKVEIGSVSKETYIIADINGILTAAKVAVNDAAFAAALADAVDALAAADAAAKAAAYAAVDAAADAAAYAADAYAAVEAADYVNVAKTACEAAKTALEKGLDLESKLKTAYMAYRVAEAVWTQLGDDYATNLETCQKNANALKEVINACYSDKVE